MGKILQKSRDWTPHRREAVSKGGEGGWHGKTGLGGGGGVGMAGSA